jgi:DNA ligase-1
MKKKKEGYVELNNKKNIKETIKNKENNKNKNNINNKNSENKKNNENKNNINIKDNYNEKTYSIRKYSPMLAYDFKKKSSNIIYPCNVQPKLDGIRAIAVKNRLYSRNGLLFPTLEHIKTELLKSNLILDGELYTDDINFEKIVGLVRKSTKTQEEEKLSLKIYFNVFDIVDKTLTFKERYSILKNFIEKNSFKYIKLVKTEICNKKEEIETFLNKYINEGYEGLIIRNMKGKYEEGLRSSNLIKLKKFKDEEFKIVDYTCAKNGKEVGCVIWICSTKEGKIFNVRPEGGYSERKKLYRNGKNYIGKMLTVKYQEMTNDNIPRFPVGVGIRDYE